MLAIDEVLFYLYFRAFFQKIKRIKDVVEKNDAMNGFLITIFLQARVDFLLSLWMMSVIIGGDKDL
jgi:hypothetical protein